MNDYFLHPAISQSKLKDLKKSPFFFYSKHIVEHEAIERDSLALKFGAAAHMALFEPEKFKNNYIVSPAFDKRTIVGKTAYNDFLNKNDGKELIEEKTMQDITNMISVILSKKITQIVLQNGLAEKELFWNDLYTEVECKAKLDYLIEPCEKYPNGLIIDLKTTVDANSDEFSKTCYKFGYYNQLAFYSLAVKAIYQTNNFPSFIFIAAEKQYPFDCAFYVGNEDMLYLGLEENKRLLELYKQCKESNNWFGYEDKINEIEMPQWAINKIKTFRGE